MSTAAKQNNEDLLKAISEVLDEALTTYDQLAKNGQGIDFAQPVDDMMGASAGAGAGPGIGETAGQKPNMAKEEDKKEDKKEDDKDKEDAKKAEDKKDKDDDKEDDEKLMNTYKSVVAKMEQRGLMQKMDKDKKVKKSDAENDLRKNVDDRFEVLTKAINSISETVKKIASAPAARKGVAGYQPLKKSEGETTPTLKKSEVLGKLLDLKKNGDARVDTNLINRFETNRLSKGDVERIKSFGILENN